MLEMGDDGLYYVGSIEWTTGGLCGHWPVISGRLWLLMPAERDASHALWRTRQND